MSIWRCGKDREEGRALPKAQLLDATSRCLQLRTAASTISSREEP